MCGAGTVLLFYAERKALLEGYTCLQVKFAALLLSFAVGLFAESPVTYECTPKDIVSLTSD